MMTKTASRVQWRLNRLYSMTLAEVCSRLVDVGRHVVLYASRQHIKRRASRPVDQTVSELRIPRLTEPVRKVPKDVQDREMAYADRWLQRHISLFELRDVRLGDTIDWHRDYASGVTGPRGYSGFIEYRNACAVGDVKYVWELNRMQHLVSLALASVWTGNPVYWAEIERQLLGWVAQNPFMTGLNWKSPLEAGLRLISWALVASLTAGSHRATAFFHRHLRAPLYQHQYVISKFFSKHSSANNHLIGEMAGLYVSAVVWPWFPESRAWRDFARHMLIQECTRQTTADGVNTELATEYQLFVLEFFLLAGALGHAIGDPFPPDYWQRLQRMMAFLAAISDCAGNLPMFGDGDSGQVVWLSETLQERTRAILRIGQPSHATPTHPATADLRAVLLLWGQTPAELPLEPVPQPEPELHPAPHGGYYVLCTHRGTDDELRVVFDAGQLGLPPIYAHGHADALSFWLSYGGHEFLIDPGTFSYYSHEAWREYFRSTAAHNTVRIDRENQSIAGSRFLWRQAARCHVERLEDNAACIEIEGYHDGYQRLADPVIHRRTMRLCKHAPQLVIIDHVECQDRHDVDMTFQFSEQCQVWQVGPSTFDASHGEKRLRICLDAQLQPALYRGAENPMAGWVSRTFGVKEPAFALTAHTNVTSSRRFSTHITAL